MMKEIDGKQVLVCDDCKKPIKPTYDADRGFVSPESDKVKLSEVMGFPAVEAVATVVCRSCYLDAFKRFYPGKKVPYLAPEIEERV